jgi:hypothetical protein
MMDKKRDRSIILGAHDNIATCLMVHILASLSKDFNNLTRLSSQQSHASSFAYAGTLTFSLISTSRLLKGSQAALSGISTAFRGFLPSKLRYAQHILDSMLDSSLLSYAQWLSCHCQSLTSRRCRHSLIGAWSPLLLTVCSERKGKSCCEIASSLRSCQ